MVDEVEMETFKLVASLVGILVLAVCLPMAVFSGYKALTGFKGNYLAVWAMGPLVMLQRRFFSEESWSQLRRARISILFVILAFVLLCFTYPFES